MILFHMPHLFLCGPYHTVCDYVLRFAKLLWVFGTGDV